MKHLGITVPYWRLSSFYFCYFAALGCLVPYWSLYLKHIGFDTVQIGGLSALLVGTKIIAPNLGGWIADHTGRSLRIIRLASFLAGLCFAGFLYTQSYSWFVGITIAFSFFWNISLPQFEAATLAHLKTETHRYSKIRLWGSIGFILTVLGVGGVLDWQPITLLPVIVAAMLFVQWLVTLMAPEVRASRHGQAPASLLEILKRREVVAFIFATILLQFAHAPYYVFYSIYLKQLEYSATFTGGLWALGVVAEIVLFAFMRSLLGRYSLKSILVLSIALSIARWLILAWGAHYLALLIVAQLLHALSFGGTHIAAIHLVHRYFGDQHQGKGQALYNSLSTGLGGMLGSLFSGYYWDLLGASGIYSIAAISCTFALLLASLAIGKEN